MSKNEKVYLAKPGGGEWRLWSTLTNEEKSEYTKQCSPRLRWTGQPRQPMAKAQPREVQDE